MHTRTLAIGFLAAFLCGPWARADSGLPRVGVRLAPFTGIVLPHQQIAGFRASVPLGLGLDVYYTPRFSLAVDLTTSRHSGGDGDLRLSDFQILGRWWFPQDRWFPFAQAGVGGYQADVDDDGGHRQLGGVGPTLGGGVEIPLASNCFAQGELRSNWARGRASDGPDGWIGHTQVLVWLGYKLP